MGTPAAGYWIRFEDVDGDIVEDAMQVDYLPEVGALLPMAEPQPAEHGGQGSD